MRHKHVLVDRFTSVRIARCLAAYLGLSGILMATGCAHLNNPFKDSGAAIDDQMGTVSAEGFQGKAEFAPRLRRNWTGSTLYYENGAVTHWPLGFEDPFEARGNRLTPVEDRDAPDNQFAWNKADYGHIFYGMGRMIVNLLALPYTAVVTPPGMLMESDARIDRGLLGFENDARPADPSKRDPPDTVDFDRPRYEQAAAQSQAAG